MTTMGCSEVKDEKLKRFAEAHLWRFAVNLYNGYQGNITNKKHLTLYEKNFIRNSYRFMKIFSKFDHLGAKIGILLSIPWLVEHQNGDGFWVEEDYKESATLGVIEALTHVGFL